MTLINFAPMLLGIQQELLRKRLSSPITKAKDTIKDIRRKWCGAGTSNCKDCDTLGVIFTNTNLEVKLVPQVYDASINGFKTDRRSRLIVQLKGNGMFNS